MNVAAEDEPQEPAQAEPLAAKRVIETTARDWQCPIAMLFDDLTEGESE